MVREAIGEQGLADFPCLHEAGLKGTGTDVAMESAGVTLVKGDLTGIVRILESTPRPRRENN